jgi:hypothetical protein
MLSSGLQHNCFLSYDCPRFRIIQYYFMRFCIRFLNLGWYFLSTISQIALPSGFSAPWFSTTVPGGILVNWNVVNQSTSLFLLALLQESFMPCWCNRIRICVQVYKVLQFDSRNSRSVSLWCWVTQTRVLNMFGHVPTCVYVSQRPNESFVRKQQRKEYMSVVYRWKNKWQDLE